jgi:hypothetical protein
VISHLYVGFSPRFVCADLSSSRGKHWLLNQSLQKPQAMAELGAVMAPPGLEIMFLEKVYLVEAATTQGLVK